MSRLEEEWENPFLTLDDGKFEITVEYITESRPIRMLWEHRWVGELPAPIEGKSSTIIRKALDFCEERGNIKKQHWKDRNTLQQKLKLFDDKFFQANHSDATDLADVACCLHIRSLFCLMKERATEMLFEKTPDEVNELFKIRYVADEATAADDLRKMKMVIRNAGWAFRLLSSFLNPVVSDA
uniref:SKP1-like protein 12 n=1 Tax=Erigeron canadensis TaxID=72917 RepID=UPI001CB8E8F4|nr:SKP1-like protein 12 [Erigeron canadensis]